jgi:glutathione S-transferase
MMLALYQAEWCPSSHRIRERLTELGVDYVAHQVPVAREERSELLAVAGASTIPALVLIDGKAVVGADAIERFLAENFDEPADAEAHRRKAETLRADYLAEECHGAPARSAAAVAGRADPPETG